MKIIRKLFCLTTLLMLGCVKEDPKFAESKYECESIITSTHPNAEHFQTFLNEKTNQGLPGISMLIETPDGIWTGASGVADIPNAIKMNSCSLHKVGSITKLFTASLILKLYEQGEIDLDHPISMYLSSEITNKIANANIATVRQLLSHTSGITDYLSQLDYTLFNYYDNPTKVWTPLEELEYIFDEPADFYPGTQTEYSNSNYLLLGMIIRNVSGVSGHELLESLIYEPLNLNNTYLFQDGTNPYRLVRGYYDEFGDGYLSDITSLRRFSNSMVGGISSNVEDLYVFLKAAITPGELFSQETINDMLTLSDLPFANDDFYFGDEYKVNRVKGIGLGWFILDTDYGIAIGHNGGYNGRRARMWHFPETQKTIIYLVNGSGESLRPIHHELFRNDMVSLLFE